MLLYWGVCVEADDCPTPVVKLWYETLRKVILDKIQKTNLKIFAIVDGQIKFRTQMKAINEQLTGSRDVKVKFLESQLKDPYNRIPENFVKRHLATIEDMFILNVDRRPFLLEKCHVWKSKTSPCGLWFHTDQAKVQPNYGLMYKNGDDLRMDGLIMQVVGLLDFLMKEVGVDLRLSAYQVLAYSKTDGVLEIVPNAVDVQEIEKKHSHIDKYFDAIIKENEKLKKAGKNVDEFFMAPPEEVKDKLQEN